jgi:hypothetical protein
LWATRSGVLLAAALISSAVAWWMIAWAPLTFANAAEHPKHFALTYAHVLGGTGMLLFGGLNLYLAARKNSLSVHRLVGRLYLASGVLGSVSAMVVTSSMAHKAAGTPVFTNASLSLLTLAMTWLAFSALGWRAVRNRRFPSHGQWMIRSYVLACRTSTSSAMARRSSGCPGSFRCCYARWCCNGLRAPASCSAT